MEQGERMTSSKTPPVISPRSPAIGVATARWLAGLALLGAVVGCDGEDSKGCTLIGSIHGLVVSLAGEPTLTDGQYVLRLTADGTDASMGFGVSEARIVCAAENETESAPGFESAYCASRVPHGNGELLLELRKDAWPPNPSGAPALVVWTYLDHNTGVARQVDIVVERDGREVGQGMFTPQYDHREVNGPGCGVTSFAEASVAVD